MKYTKKNKGNRNQERRDATWEKYKQQQNQLNAKRRGVKW